MSVTRRIFTQKFKVDAIKQLEAGKGMGSVARRLEVNPNTLHRWRRKFNKNPTQAFSGQGRKMVLDTEVAELERKVGQMTMEIDFLKKLLMRFEEREGESLTRGSTRESGKKIRR